MNLELLHAGLQALGPDVQGVALCSARLVPIAFLCPLLGGQATPVTVRLALVLGLALFLRLEAGVGLVPDIGQALTRQRPIRALDLPPPPHGHGLGYSTWHLGDATAGIVHVAEASTLQRRAAQS